MEGFVLGVAVAIVKISGDCHDGGAIGYRNLAQSLKPKRALFWNCEGLLN